MRRLQAIFMLWMLLSTASVSWADTHTSTGSGNASAGGTWVGGVAPENNDSIVIADDHAVGWDIDSSAWANGVAGLTITGDTDGDGTPGMLYFKTSGTTNWLRIKTGTTLNGTTVNGVKGRLLANSDGAWATNTVYPFTAKGAIELLTTAYLDGTNLNVKILCAEPANPAIELSADEAVGQTVLSVATNVTGDIWADGDTVSICDAQKTQEHETRVIAAGGIAATTITVTAGLTAQKEAGASDEKTLVILATRNFRIIGGSGATQPCIMNLTGTGNTVNAWMYCATAGQGYAFDTSCDGVTIGGGYCGVGPTSGWASGWSRVFSACTNFVITAGAWSGNTYAINGGSGHTISGVTCAGNGYALNGGSGHTVTSGIWRGNNDTINGGSAYTVTGGTWSGSVYGVRGGSGHTITGGTWRGNTYGVNGGSGHTITGGTWSGGSYGIYGGSGHTISGGTFSGNATADISGGSQYIISNATLSSDINIQNVILASCYNVAFGTGTEINGYNTNNIPQWGYIGSYDHDQVAGAFKATCRGGITLSSTTAPLPPGYTKYYVHTCEEATMWNFRQEYYPMKPSEKLVVNGYMKIGHDMSGAGAPKLEIIDVFADPLVDAANAALASAAIPVADGSETGWQAVSVNYTNTATIRKPVYIRMSVKHADNTLSEVMTNITTLRGSGANLDGELQ